MSKDQALGFPSKRQELLGSYFEKGGTFIAQTKPYKSTASLLFEVFDAKPTNAPVMAHAVAAKATQIRWFSYAVGDAIMDVLTNRSFAAPQSWTNQGKGSETNGGVDFVIEGLSLSFRPPRFLYDAAVVNPADFSNPAVKTMYDGLGTPGGDTVPPAVVDPAALASPPQVGSPFNLEQSFASLISPALSMLIQFNREQSEYVGSADEFPEGGAKSYLRANGQPRIDNRYKIPEGYLWRRAGEPDSQMNIIGTLGEALVIPINAIPVQGTTTPLVLPTRIAVDIVCRAHGLSVRRPSTNS